MNTVFGRFFDVDPVEAFEPAAFAERSPGGQFIFDIQVHHVDAPKHFPNLLHLRAGGRRWNPDLQKDRGTMDDLYLENFIKEVFLDSDTTVAMDLDSALRLRTAHAGGQGPYLRTQLRAPVRRRSGRAPEPGARRLHFASARRLP